MVVDLSRLRGGGFYAGAYFVLCSIIVIIKTPKEILRSLIVYVAIGRDKLEIGGIFARNIT